MSSPQLIFVNRFFHPDHSATSQILSDLVFYLARSGMSASVIASSGLYDDPDADLPEFETKNGVAIHRVYRPRFGRRSLAGRAIDYLAMYRGFAAAAWRLGGPGDLLIVKTDPPLLSAALAPVARFKNLSMINWSKSLSRVGAGARRATLAPIAPLLVAARNASLKMAVRNVVIGERMRHRLEALGVAPEQIETIPNWCDDDLVAPMPIEGNPLRSAWGLDGKFVIGYSGNLGRPHEYATLLDAAERLRGERNVIFLFIGGGHLMQSLQADVDQRASPKCSSSGLIRTRTSCRGLSPFPTSIGSRSCRPWKG